MKFGGFFLVVGMTQHTLLGIQTISSNDRIHDKEPLAKYSNKMIKAIRKIEQNKWVNDRHTLHKCFCCNRDYWKNRIKLAYFLWMEENSRVL